MIKEVTYDNADFLRLCGKLEQEHVNVIAEQRSPNGNCLENLDKFNHILLYFEGNQSVGCLAVSKPVNDVVEIGRLYVLPEYRNKKIASKLFEKAFTIIQQEENKAAVLNTYERFEAAVHLYKTLGFQIVDKFEDLKNSPYSICMQKNF